MDEPAIQARPSAGPAVRVEPIAEPLDQSHGSSRLARLFSSPVDRVLIIVGIALTFFLLGIMVGSVM